MAIQIAVHLLPTLEDLRALEGNCSRNPLKCCQSYFFFLKVSVSYSAFNWPLALPKDVLIDIIPKRSVKRTKDKDNSDVFKGFSVGLVAFCPIACGLFRSSRSRNDPAIESNRAPIWEPTVPMLHFFLK